MFYNINTKVDGSLENRRHRWRASLRRDDCGGTENDDFFVVKELSEVDADVTSERTNKDVGGKRLSDNNVYRSDFRVL
jgi:hypothetical protein